MENNNKCCGNCCWFKYEETDGWGQCVMQDICDSMHCSDLCTTDEYVSNEECRHYIAVLIQANRYRRDNNVPAIYRMPDPKDLGQAIDFAIKYIKQFSEI